MFNEIVDALIKTSNVWDLDLDTKQNQRKIYRADYFYINWAYIDFNLANKNLQGDTFYFLNLLAENNLNDLGIDCIQLR